MMFLNNLKNVTRDWMNVTPDAITVTSGLKIVTPDANNVTPGLTRGPFSLMGNEMKVQNGFRVKPGMTGVAN
jgi:hypothetical protein